MTVSTVEPVVDDFGLVWMGSAWVALSHVQEALMRVLVARRGSPVSRRELLDAGWSTHPSPRGLDVQMAKLRQRIAPLGLVIVTIRGRGFILLDE